MAQTASGGRNWTFLTNHAHVLLALARQPDARLRDVAVEVGITERACQAIVLDLETAGYLVRHRIGRRNRYTIDPDGPFRHPAEADHRIGDLIALLAAPRAEHPAGGPVPAHRASSLP
ncbi:ArsR family transcriptional regulator [Catellatospora sp. IY07-71]|uniref:helix-turn-helix transcriptional regulator n=1 Tax=Catellatospora sp. IY07-71 TaxID=2728827 RepID=UPI001BB2FD64|nr:MarR family transcriptional regulator [Catellatospora sp. IY07-71]BCJ75815.1 ArsR family transcriptional regulator [Catellatospora sp. IY07-71]